MPKRKSSRKQSPLSKFKKRLFRATGISLGDLSKGAAFLVVVFVGIFCAIFSSSTRESSDVSKVEDVEQEAVAAEEMFIELTKLPPRFVLMRTVEKIALLRSKIKIGEELARSDEALAQRAVDPLIKFYGVICYLQEEEGIESEKDYVQLANFRQKAATAGSAGSVATADFYRALAGTNRLYRHTEQTDFHFALDAVLNLDSKKLVDFKQMSTLYATAIKLYDTSRKKESTGKFLSVLADKLTGSPKYEISNLGLDLKDHARFAQFHAAVASKPYTTRKSKLQFFRDMFDEIEKDPPQSPRVYQTVLFLIDRLLNRSDGFFAGTLVKRIRKVSSNISPNIKPVIDRAIGNVETRLGAIGKTVDLSGADFRGSPLQLPKVNPTVLLFCKTSDAAAMKYVKSIAQSNRFNPWSTNLVVASISTPSVEELEKVAKEFSQFTVLDNETTNRLQKTFAINLVPYQVFLDKDDKVISLGAPVD